MSEVLMLRGESRHCTDCGTTTIFLPGNKEDYRIEVLNPSAGGTSVAIHSYDQNGNGAVQLTVLPGLDDEKP